MGLKILPGQKTTKSISKRLEREQAISGESSSSPTFPENNLFSGALIAELRKDVNPSDNGSHQNKDPYHHIPILP
jgi:hypothetical protein